MPRLAACYEVVQTAAALNAGGGTTVVVALDNKNWALLISILATFVTSASVGNRLPIVQIKDSAGLVVWDATRGTAITAGTTTILAIGSAVPSYVLTTPARQYTALPAEMIVPPLSTITFSDSAAVDAADTVAANILLSY